MVEAGLTAERPAVRLRRWAGILSAFFTAQGLVQLAGVAAGILLVRTLPVREFALYTLALSVTTFFTFLSDLGSTGSLVHFFHRAARKGEEFRPYLAAVLSLRRLGFLVGAAAVAVAFPRAAAAKGYESTEIALVLAVILVTVWFQIGAALRLLALRLADRYGVSYRAEVAGAVLRLLLTAALVAAALLRAWIGMLASAVGTAATALLAARDGGVPRPPEETDLRPYRRRVLRYLLPTLPSALYFSVQGPLVVWLAATFGATRNIAEVGALSRLGMIVGLFSSLSGVVFLPRLARITDERAWRVRYLQFGGALAAITLALLAAAALFPGPLLWILGAKYSGLHRELVLVVAGAGLTLLDGYAVGVNLARSWSRWQGLAMLSLVAVQALLVAALPLSTTQGVLTFNLLSSAAALVGQLAVAGVGFTRPQWVEWR
jgi:O-antigen/teichoic acid export membrane protein